MSELPPDAFDAELTEFLTRQAEEELLIKLGDEMREEKTVRIEQQCMDALARNGVDIVGFRDFVDASYPQKSVGTLLLSLGAPETWVAFGDAKLSEEDVERYAWLADGVSRLAQGVELAEASTGTEEAKLDVLAWLHTGMPTSNGDKGLELGKWVRAVDEILPSTMSTVADSEIAPLAVLEAIKRQEQDRRVVMFAPVFRRIAEKAGASFVADHNIGSHDDAGDALNMLASIIGREVARVQLGQLAEVPEQLNHPFRVMIDTETEKLISLGWSQQQAEGLVVHMISHCTSPTE